MVMDFGATWDAVVGAIAGVSADTSSRLYSLGLREASVAAGELGRSMPMKPPFAYVYLLPVAGVGSRATDGVPQAPTAELRVFCGVEPEATSRAALGAAVDLGAAVLAVLRRELPALGIVARFDASPLRLDSYTTKLAAIEVAGVVHYSLPA